MNGNVQHQLQKSAIPLLAVIMISFASCHSLPVYYSGRTGFTGKKSTPSSPKISKELRKALMDEIDLWKGTPYRFGMVERSKGTDCSGFVGYLYKKIFLIELPRQSADMARLGKRVSKNDLRFADLVFFKNTYKGSKGVSHVGIFVGRNQIAHASTTEGVTLSDLSESYYIKHYFESRRIIE